MTAIVTIHETDSPGTKLIKLERELRIQHPHLSEGEARHLVRETAEGAALWQLHHQGLQAEPEPTVDAGEVLNKRAHELLASRAAMSFSQAVEMAQRQLPDAAAAYQAGVPLLASQAANAPGPTAYQSADAGDEVLRFMAEAMAADAALTVDAARRQVLARDPTLARHYSEQTPLPTTPQPTSSERLVEQALVASMALRAELEKLAHQVRKFMELTVAEKQAYLAGYRGKPVVATFTQAEHVAYARGASTRSPAP